MCDSNRHNSLLVLKCGEPKFQHGKGGLVIESNTYRQCAFPEQNIGELVQHPTAAIASADVNYGIQPSCALKPSAISAISGTDSNNGHVSMAFMEKYLRMPMSLYAIGDALTTLPSPRKRLFNLILSATGLKPNTVKMILCSTDSGYTPSAEVKRSISRALGKSAEMLFPEDRRRAGSLVDLYKKRSSKKLELHLFLNLLSKPARASPKTVRRWLVERRVPDTEIREDISKVIGVSILQLFPPEGSQNIIDDE